MSNYVVDLKAAKSNTRYKLRYETRPLPNKQKRLAGRLGVFPDIKFENYITKAVIDWVELEIAVLGKTQSRWMAEKIGAITGRTPSVEDLSGEEFESYIIRLQEPDIGLLAKGLEAVDRDKILVVAPSVSGLEVSIDFRPKEPSDEARARMLAVLFRHLDLEPARFQTKRDRARFSFGKGKSENQSIFGDPSHLSNQDFVHMFSVGDNLPPLDATVYFGAKEADVFWRLMDKVVDDQDKRSNTFTVLPEKERRTRIEVSFKKAELRSLGITSLESLQRFQFSKLGGKYFPFSVPTILELKVPNATKTSGVSAVRSSNNDARLRKFLNLGMFGLRMFDETWGRVRRKERKNMISVFKSRRVRMKLNRSGAGKGANHVSFEALKRQVDYALRHLQERVRQR